MRREDCPSIIDNICQGNVLGITYHVTCCFDRIIHLRKKSYFMESLFRVVSLKSPSEHPIPPHTKKTPKYIAIPGNSDWHASVVIIV